VTRIKTEKAEEASEIVESLFARGGEKPRAGSITRSREKAREGNQMTSPPDNCIGSRERFFPS